MDWRDELYLSQFRGVFFHVKVASAEFGRRHEIHEFPDQDGATVDDFGRRPDRFTLDAFVIGDDWLTQKRKLIEACTGRGAKDGGTLVHPWFGALAVYCTLCKISESNLEGNFVRFELEFVRVAGNPRTLDRATPASDADAAAAAASESARAETAAGLTADNVPDFVREGSAAALVQIGETMTRGDVFGSIAFETAALAEDIASLIDDAAQFATAPIDAALLVKTAVERVIAAARNLPAALVAYETFFELQALELGGTSFNASARDANARLLIAQARQTAIAGAVRAAAAIKWETHDDAVRVRDRILEALDRELDEASPAQFGTLAALRVALVASTPPPGEALPRIVQLTLEAPTSALELAYALYDDAERATEIIERNRPAFAGSLPALSVVEVLSR